MLTASKLISAAKKNPIAYLISSLGYLIDILNLVSKSRTCFFSLKSALLITSWISYPKTFLLINCLLSGWPPCYSLNMPSVVLLSGWNTVYVDLHCLALSPVSTQMPNSLWDFLSPLSFLYLSWIIFLHCTHLYTTHFCFLFLIVLGEKI